MFIKTTISNSDSISNTGQILVNLSLAEVIELRDNEAILQVNGVPYMTCEPGEIRKIQSYLGISIRNTR